MPANPHQPLSDDVRLLGELLGETLRRHGGDGLFEAVERVRALSKRGRSGSDEDFRALTRELGRLPVESALPLARAFAHFLTLANIAEQHHRLRRRRAYLRDPSAGPQRGSCDEVFGRLVAAGVSRGELFGSLCAARIELVLTPHPTEVVRRSLRQKHLRIADALAVRDRADLTVVERTEVVDSLRREIAAAWETDEVRHERPSPLDEVRSGLVVFEQSLWDAVPRYLRSLDRALRKHTGRALPLDVAPVRFGSWMGGDRDGNPHVTPEVTRRACLLARWLAIDLYIGEVASLRAELTMVDGDAELRERVAGAREPYRVLLREVGDRLLATRRSVEAALSEGHMPPEGARATDAAATPAPDIYPDVEAFAAPLRLCHRSLVATGNGLIAEGRLTDLLRRVATFGLTLVRLDVRQDASRHAGAIDAMTRHLGIGAYREWTESERVRFLLAELESGRPLMPPDLPADDAVRDVGRGGGPHVSGDSVAAAGLGRGAAPCHRAGQMIQTMFGLTGIALRTLEVYTTATLEATLRPADLAPPAWRESMDRLSEAARRGYRQIVYEHPRFVEYFRSATPERELEALNVGSRPARRRAGEGVESLRAIPWQFAWTQTRLLLASWLGVEMALAAEDRARLREMYRGWPFFRSTLDLMEMVLAKADARIAARYDQQLVPADLQPLGRELGTRLGRAIEGVLEVTGHTELLRDNPVLRRSIDVRNPYVDPINLVQIELLRRLRQGSEDQRLRWALMMTVNGVAAGMRNTG